MNIEIDNLYHVKKIKRTTWNLRASTEKWAEYENELQNRLNTATTDQLMIGTEAGTMK